MAGFHTCYVNSWAESSHNEVGFMLPARPSQLYRETANIGVSVHQQTLLWSREMPKTFTDENIWSGFTHQEKILVVLMFQSGKLRSWQSVYNRSSPRPSIMVFTRHPHCTSIVSSYIIILSHDCQMQQKPRNWGEEVPVTWTARAGAKQTIYGAGRFAWELGCVQTWSLIRISQCQEMAYTVLYIKQKKQILQTKMSQSMSLDGPGIPCILTQSETRTWGQRDMTPSRGFSAQHIPQAHPEALGKNGCLVDIDINTLTSHHLWIFMDIMDITDIMDIYGYLWIL